jgi:hypothetical protein
MAFQFEFPKLTTRKRYNAARIGAVLAIILAVAQYFTLNQNPLEKAQSVGSLFMAALCVYFAKVWHDKLKAEERKK